MTTDDARRRTAKARARLWSTLSGKKVNAADADTSTETVYIPMADVIRLNAAKAEMRSILAGIPPTVVKQNAGIRSVVEDSTGTNLQPGQTVYDGGYQVTVRGRTLEQILADQDVPTPIPAITSRQTQGQSDWSPIDAQDANFSDDDDDESADPGEESAKILAMYTDSNGRVCKHARAHFLTYSGDGTQAGDYAVPLSRMNRLSQLPEYFDKFLDEAFLTAAGRESGLANYGKMSRVIRIKQRNGMPLTEDQKSHVARHMT